MRDVFLLLLLPVITMVSCNVGDAQHHRNDWKWSMMLPVPDTLGFAGSFAGKLDDGIILLGGANFPDGKLPWEGGKKHWTDKIFFLEDNSREWLEPGRLPIRLGYGASASLENAFYVGGGSNETGHQDKVYRITLENDSLQIVELQPLPMPLANMSGIRVGTSWYIVGGTTKPDAVQAENVCFRMDLKQPEGGWEVCPPLPGDGRMLAVLGTDGKALYVFSGVALRDGQRQYLRDTYRYRPGEGWAKLTNLPRAVAAAPSPCFYDSDNEQFFIFGGDDGELAQMQLGRGHPGFSNRIHMFDVERQKWYDQQTMDLLDSLPPVTTTAIVVRDTVVLPMGEVKPGIRTSQVIQGSMLPHKAKNL